MFSNTRKLLLIKKDSTAAYELSFFIEGFSLPNHIKKHLDMCNKGILMLYHTMNKFQYSHPSQTLMHV